MVIPGLQMGGAETFFTRLALALRQRGHKVVVSLFRSRGDSELLKSLRGAGIPVYIRPLTKPAVYRLLYKLSAELGKLTGGLSLVDWLHCRHLRALQRRYSFDAVNAHLIPAQRIACLAFPHRTLRIVGSDHGDWRWQNVDRCSPDLEAVARRMDVLVCPCKDNLGRVESYRWAKGILATVIYYGYEVPPHRMSQPTGMTGKVFTFGMIARGSERDKGWEEAVRAFMLVKKDTKRPVRLVLVGAGDALDKARALAGNQENDSLVCTGYQSASESWIGSFDVALLPTCYGPESLPCVIIECLAQHKPVISTPIGGIPEMLTVDGEVAGALVPLDQDGRASVQDLRSAMLSLVEDVDALEKAKLSASKAALRFDMASCVSRYEDVLGGCQESHRSNCHASLT